MDTKDIGALVIGLAVALVIVAYVAPIGIEALYGVEYRGWGVEHEGGEAYEYNVTNEGWYKYNASSGAYDISVTSREDTKVTGLIKLLPLFAALCIVISVIAIAKRVMS